MARRNIPILVIPNNPPNQLVNIPIPQRLIINEIVYHENEIVQSHFRFVRKLGCGAFATVDHMVHDPTEADLAVKKITISPGGERNLHLERELLHRFEHINVVDYFGYKIFDNQAWIFLEKMDICFENLLQRLGVIPEQVIQKVAVSIIDALDFLRQNFRIIHRDIKPSNILINRNGIIKCSDFGMAGLLVNSMTRSQSRGCIFYLAPERINHNEQSEPYNTRSDVWSIGITLLQMATGVLPYTDSPNRSGYVNVTQLLSNINNDFQAFVVMTRILNEDPRIPGHLLTDMRNFIQACLTRDMNQRPNYADLRTMAFYQMVNEYSISEWINNVLEN